MNHELTMGRFLPLTIGHSFLNNQELVPFLCAESLGDSSGQRSANFPPPEPVVNDVYLNRLTRWIIMVKSEYCCLFNSYSTIVLLVIHHPANGEKVNG